MSNAKIKLNSKEIEALLESQAIENRMLQEAEMAASRIESRPDARVEKVDSSVNEERGRAEGRIFVYGKYEQILDAL